jgi:hypothetical protein
VKEQFVFVSKFPHADESEVASVFADGVGDVNDGDLGLKVGPKVFPHRI